MRRRLGRRVGNIEMGEMMRRVSDEVWIVKLFREIMRYEEEEVIVRGVIVGGRLWIYGVKGGRWIFKWDVNMG
ncbi:hypothetical protein [Clostridium beijerinckii]|uniref:hypothetical protein n=1 Tax=Clostridium beijerinckii TaxID=1520 RepID=UPI0017E85305|nr:hypothetical protein [Clostridium beijerinckii]NYC92084.1 hypothetical protein [Clostridium beijerinckii]